MQLLMCRCSHASDSQAQSGALHAPLSMTIAHKGACVFAATAPSVTHVHVVATAGRTASADWHWFKNHSTR
jgi:hypothetical protein